MKRLCFVMVGIMAVGPWMSPSTATAKDELRNEVTAHITPGKTDHDAVVEIRISNINSLIGMTLPFKFDIGGDSLIFDSLSLQGGRAPGFVVVNPTFNPSNNTLLVNMLSGLDPKKMAPPVPPGEGPLLWLYFRTPGKFPLKKFKMASVQILPENVLLFVTETYNSVNPAFELHHGPAASDQKQEPRVEEKSKGKTKTP